MTSEMFWALPDELKEMNRQCLLRAGFEFCFTDGTVEDLDRTKIAWRAEATKLYAKGNPRAAKVAAGLLDLIPFIESHRQFFLDADTPMIVG